jgi:hypothetical protein
MKRATDLTREQLIKIVDTAQRAFWLTDYEAEVWRPDTEWTWERVEYIAEVMIDCGLRPDEPCEMCGVAYEDGGDGWDGLCPSCADKVSEYMDEHDGVDRDAAIEAVEALDNKEPG